MNGRTNSSGSSVNDLQIPLDPCTNLECVAGNAQVELTWTDPLNKYATPEGEVAEDPDQLVSVWHHTVVIRKVGSAPVGIDDGIVVVSSEVKNQYQSTAYIDTGLVNDTTYYYGVFAINEDGVESEGSVSEGVTPKLGTPLSELAEGTIIKINENGAPVEFYLAKHNYEPDLNGPGRELLVRKDSEGNRHWRDDRYYTPLYKRSDIASYLGGTGYISKFETVIQQLIGTTNFHCTAPLERDQYIYEGAAALCSFTELNLESPLTPPRPPKGNDGYILPIWNTLLNVPDGFHWTRSIYDNDHGPYKYQGDGNRIASFTGTGWSMYSYCPIFTIPESSMVDSLFNLLPIINITQ